MFSAIGRYLRAFGYLITGRIDAARKELSTNPYVVQATYDKIVQEKTIRIAQYKDAVAALIAQEEKKKNRIRELTSDVNRLEQLKQGAAAKAKAMVEQLKARGVSMEQIKKNEEYAKCLAAFNDFTSTLAEKNTHIAELEEEVKTASATIANHKVQLQSLLREIEKVREEAAATVADVITAKEEQQIADMISGISQDSTSKELQEMRDLRQQVKAGARISRELAGTDTKRMEADFMDYAQKSASNAEFDALIGLAGSAEKAAPAADTADKSRLPEA